jgi:VWFA-related protein
MKISSAALLVLLAVLSLAGQSTPNQAGQQMPTFRAETELVTVPVVVTKGGKHVTGLTKEDFTVLEDGTPRSAAFFEEIKARPSAIQGLATPAGTYNNEIAKDQQPTAVTMVLLDALNTPALEQGESRRKVIEFLGSAAAKREPMMLATIGRQGLKVIHTFTTSPDVLLAAVRQVKTNMEGSHQSAEDKGFEQDLTGVGSISGIADVTKETADIGAYMTSGTNDLISRSAETSAVERRAEITLIAMEQLVRAVGGIQGRKALLWATGGTVCEPGVSVGGMHQGLIDKCNKVWHLLSTNNIAVYPIQVSQSLNPGFVSPGMANPNRNEPRGMQTQLILESYAKYTGGKVCGFRNDDSCYREAADDSSQYYLVSYYTTPTPQAKWRKISVKVKTPGTSVRARNGYLTAPRPNELEDQRKNDVAMAIISPIDYTGVPMTVKWLGETNKDGKRQFRFQIAIAPGGLNVDENDHNHLKLNIIAYAMDAQGNHVGDLTKDLNAHMQDKNLAMLKQQGFGYTDVLEVPPGNFLVKFIVRDDLSGRMGTVTAPTPRVVSGG